MGEKIMGITKDGDKVEQKLEDIARSIEDNPDKSGAGKAKGDKIVNHRNNKATQYYIEVKKKTWNQCRPYKYLVNVGHNPDTGDWFVVPPDEMVMLSIGKKGQHARDSLECAGHNVPTNNSKKWKKYWCAESEVEKKIWEAYEQGERNKKLKEYCDDYKKKLKERAEQTQAELQLLCG